MLRKDHGGLGLVKAYQQIAPRGLGRDRFVGEMTRRGHALPRRLNHIRTTRSSGGRFPNLIKNLIINDINIVWQSDTTYFRLGDRFCYLTFIIDVYSRRLLGFSVSMDLRAEANVAALRHALRTRQGQDLSQVIFHSDGGTQYRYAPFVELLRSHGISSSMCNAATDNAYAEKLNDVIKNEYLAYQDIIDLGQLRKRVKKAVDNYNRTRLHGRLPGRWTPLAYERYLRDNEPPAVHQPLLIRDGQAEREYWQPTAFQNLAHPRVWAPKGVSQILPANVILHQPMRDPQLVLEL
jgi:transposase InsO family protein